MRRAVRRTYMALRLVVREREMRFVPTAVVVSTLSLICPYTPASGLDDSPLLAALEAKADQAEPRDRCFLYAQLVRTLPGFLT